MDMKKELTIYIGDVNFVLKELRLNTPNSKISEFLSCLENYYDQIESIKSPTCTFLTSQLKIACTSGLIDRREIKEKLLFKLNGLANEQIELLEDLM